MRVGVIGAGRVLSYYLDAAHGSGIEIAGICDINDARLLETAGDLPCFSDYQDLANLCGLDALVVSVSTSRHFEVALEALQTGKPLIVEKPVTLTVGQFERLREEARSSGTPVFTMFHASYGAELQAAREVLAQRSEKSGADLSIDWYATFQDPYANDTSAQSSLVNSWIDSGINAISCVLAVLPGANLTRLSGNHSPPEGDWATSSSRQSFNIEGEWSGKLTIETDWELGQNYKASTIKLTDTSTINLYHSDESIEVLGSSDRRARSFRTGKPRLVNHYTKAFIEARKYIESSRSNWDFSRACHSPYFSCFP